MDACMGVLMVLGIKAKSTSFYVIMKKFPIIFLIFAWPCEMHLRMKFSIAYLTIWHGYEIFSIYVQTILETWTLLQTWHNNFTCSCEFSHDYANWTREQGNNPCNCFFYTISLPNYNILIHGLYILQNQRNKKTTQNLYKNH